MTSPAQCQDRCKVRQIWSLSQGRAEQHYYYGRSRVGHSHAEVGSGQGQNQVQHKDTSSRTGRPGSAALHPGSASAARRPSPLPPRRRAPSTVTFQPLPFIQPLRAACRWTANKEDFPPSESPGLQSQAGAQLRTREQLHYSYNRNMHICISFEMKEEYFGTEILAPDALPFQLGSFTA